MPPKVEASSLQEEVQPTGKVIASGSAPINPHVTNAVYMTFDLLKKAQDEYPYSDFKVKVVIDEQWGATVEDMNAVINALPVDKKERTDVKIVIPFNTRIHNKTLTYELVDQAPLAGDFLASLATSVEVVPNPNE